MRRLLGWLLGWANAYPPVVYREDFYALKRRLLERYGTLTGTKEQHLVKPCWGEREWDHDWGEYGYQGCGPDCRRCGGTGKYEEFWVTLQEWELGGHWFHVPVGGKRRLPLVANGRWIEGLIRHDRNPQRCREALLWLCLFCDQRLLLRLLASGYNCTCYAWPLLNLQRAIGVTREWWRRGSAGRSVGAARRSFGVGPGLAGMSARSAGRPGRTACRSEVMDEGRACLSGQGLRDPAAARVEVAVRAAVA